MALHHLGLHDIVSADWQALSAEPEGSGSDSDPEGSQGAPTLSSYHCTAATEPVQHCNTCFNDRDAQLVCQVGFAVLVGCSVILSSSVSVPPPLSPTC